MPTLFISYPREYRAVVERLVGNLRSSGYDPFFDEQLAGGQSWWDELLTRIENADVFMPIIGTLYLQSTPCQLEAQYATTWNKRILPVMIEPVPSQLFMPSIATAHWVDYTPHRENAILDVIRAINLLPPAVPPPDPRPERPKAPISYMTELQNEVQGSAEISRERQLVLIADLKGRLSTGDKDAALMLLSNLRARPDLYYQSATDIDELLAANGVRPGGGRARWAAAVSSGDAFDLSSVETVVVRGGTIGQAAATAAQPLATTTTPPATAGQPTTVTQPTTAGQPIDGQAAVTQQTSSQQAAWPTAARPATTTAFPASWPTAVTPGGHPTAAQEPSLAQSALHPVAQPTAAWPSAPTPVPAPPGPVPAPPGPVPAPGPAPQGGRPNSYVPLGIVATVLFIPLGIIALVMGSKVHPAWDSGDYAGAVAASKQAKGWAIAGMIVGAAIILYLIGTNGMTTE